MCLDNFLKKFLFINNYFTETSPGLEIIINSNITMRSFDAAKQCLIKWILMLIALSQIAIKKTKDFKETTTDNTNGPNSEKVKTGL